MAAVECQTPMTTAERCNIGHTAFQASDYVGALSHYNQATGDCEGETLTEINLKKAQCLVELERYKEALVVAEKITDKNPKHIQAYAVQGKCLTCMLKFEDAYAAFKKGLDLDSDNKEIAYGLRDLQNAIMKQYEDADKEEESNYDALKLCTQEKYPGDEDVEACEKEIMMTWKLADKPNLAFLTPDPDKAKGKVRQALKARADGNLEKAVGFADEAMELDVTNFDNWRVRIELLYETRNFKEAFRTVNAFPEHARSASTWLMGGKILAALELPLSAENWLRRATTLNKDPENKEAAILFQKVRVFRLYGPLAEGTNAEVTFTQYGRAVCAKKDLGNHDIVMSDKPVILAQTFDTHTIPACCHCAVSMIRPHDVFDAADLKKDELKKALAQCWPKMKIITCQCCTKEIYCSNECRDEAWLRYHRVVCPSSNKAIGKLYEICDEYKTLKDGNGRAWKGWWNASFSPFILVKMWASIACEAQRLAAEDGRKIPRSADWVLAQAPLRRFIAYGASSNAEVIPNMFELMVEIFKDLGDGLKYNVTKREFDGRYFQATCNVQAFSDSRNPLRIFIERFQKSPKWDKIVNFIPVDPPEAEFAGLFPLHACMNHSCANNAEVMDYVVNGKPGVGVRIRGGIKKGEEVFITYINTTMPRRQRRAWLYRSYNFWCRCMRCNFEGDSPNACTQCGKAPEEGQKLPQCSKCKKAWYCSPACQKVAWKKGHKKICSMGHSNTSSACDQYILKSVK